MLLLDLFLKKPSLDPGIIVNYRPISNLPFISKIVERLVVSQLSDHLNRNRILEVFQSGFRGHHSSETALVEVTNLFMASNHSLVSILVLRTSVLPLILLITTF